MYKRQVGVVLDSGEELSGNNILSSAGAVETFKLCEADEQLHAHTTGQLSFVEAISTLDKYPRELGHNKTIVFFNDSETFYWERPTEDFCDLRTGVVCTPNNYCYDEKDGELPEGVMRVTALADYERWRALGQSDYRSQKQSWFDQVQASAARFVPDYRPHVIDTDMFTPHTIHRFTWHENGAVYGATRKWLDGKTDINNLFLCGTDQGFVGIIGSIVSGISMANQHLLARS